VTGCASSVCMRGVKWFGLIGIASLLAGCMTLENRRDLYTADFDRSPLSWPSVQNTTSASSSVSTTQPKPVTAHKAAPEVKPIPDEPEESPNLPGPLPTPP
jgi:hypothetical protein